MQLNTSGRDLTESAIAGPWHRNLHFNHRIQPTSVSDKLELLLVIRHDEDNVGRPLGSAPGRNENQAAQDGHDKHGEASEHKAIRSLQRERTSAGPPPVWSTALREEREARSRSAL